MGVTTYKTWVKGAHLLIGEGRTRRYTGLIPKISPLAVLTLALAQRKINKMARQVPLDAPWTAPRAAEWDARSVASWLEHSGIRTTIARDLFESAVRGLMTADLSEASLLHLLYLAHSHGSIDTLFSIENGAQENMVNGGAGSIARRVADQLDGSIRLSTPVRAITQRDDHVLVAGDELTVSARNAVVSVPPALALEIAFDPPLPEDRTALYRNAIGGWETKTIVVYDEPFWRADGYSGQTAEPGSAAEVTLDASPVVRESGRHRGVHVRAGRAAPGVARRRRASQGGARRARRSTRPPRGEPRRVHRDLVVDGGMVPRLLDGAFHARHAHALRTPAAGAVRTRALGRHRDGDGLARRDRRCRSFRRACRSRDPRPRLGLDGGR